MPGRLRELVKGIGPDRLRRDGGVRAGPDRLRRDGGVRAGLRRAAFLVGLWIAVFALAGSHVCADGIGVISDSAEARFGHSVTFHLELESAADMQEATLFYRLVGEIVTVREPVPVRPGQRTFDHTWELEPGDVPVGAQLEYHWRVVDATGQALETRLLRLSYDDDRFTWKTLQAGQVKLFYYGSNQAQAERLLGYATQAMARLQDEVRVALDPQVRVYVYQSKSDMSLALSSHSEDFDARIVTLGVAVDRSTLLILGPHEDVEGTMAHELSHIVVGQATENSYDVMPRWLDEGLAMNAEGALPSQNESVLKEAIQADQLISVRSLSGYANDPAEVDLFYGEVYSLVDFMLKSLGKEKMAALLGAFREGLTQEQALQRTYGFGVDELDRQWRASLGLGLRPTPAPGATAVPRRARSRQPSPCPLSLGALFGLTALAFWRGRARAA